MRHFLFCDSLVNVKLLKGKKIADMILDDLRKKTLRTKNKPALAVILVGENKASKLYIKLKARAAKKIGVGFVLYKFKADTKEKSIIEIIKKLNKDKKINGIIVQLPLPGNLNTGKIISSIDPKKDADGFHPKNVDKFLRGGDVVEPVFPSAIIGLLENTNKNLINKKAVIIANSEIFGKIMREALKMKNITSQVLSRFNLDRRAEFLKEADIIITAVGKPGLIKGSMIKKGAIIIDGGITKKGRRALGDIDFNSVVKKAAFLSPVPGGVGPMTVACLLENVYRLSLKR